MTSLNSPLMVRRPDSAFSNINPLPLTGTKPGITDYTIPRAKLYTESAGRLFTLLNEYNLVVASLKTLETDRPNAPIFRLLNRFDETMQKIENFTKAELNKLANPALQCNMG